MSDDIARNWDDNANVWTRHIRAGYDVYRDAFNNPAFFAFLGEIVGLKLLDAGCGEGMTARLLAERGARVTACDISEKLLADARAEETQTPRGINYVYASMGNLAPFDDASFDVVVSTMALMDCDCYDDAMRAFHRVLRPGGLLAFNILHPCFSHKHVEWKRDADGRYTSVRLGDYFDEGAYTETWQFTAAPDKEDVRPFTIIYHHRTLTRLLNPLCAAGFHLEVIDEPQPSLEACARIRGLDRHRLIPQVLLVKARKR